MSFLSFLTYIVYIIVLLLHIKILYFFYNINESNYKFHHVIWYIIWFLIAVQITIFFLGTYGSDPCGILKGKVDLGCILNQKTFMRRPVFDIKKVDSVFNNFTIYNYLGLNGIFFLAYFAVYLLTKLLKKKPPPTA